MAKYNLGDGVWRTIGGRRVFIKKGQDLASAMKESGKFGTKKENNEQFEVSDLKRRAMETLPKSDIDSHDSDLYIKKTPESTKLLNNMKNKDSGLLTTFKDQQTGETWYEVPFANMEDDYKSKLTKSGKDKEFDRLVEASNKIDKADRKKALTEKYLPKETEIKTQGKSNRKEVSENIQAHILEHYDNPVDFVEQMDAMDYLPTRWQAGQRLAEGGSYLIYNGDMADFLNSLKINPKGKTFSDTDAFNMYTSLIGRESANLYDRLQKMFNDYRSQHGGSDLTLDDFRKWFE